MQFNVILALLLAAIVAASPLSSKDKCRQAIFKQGNANNFCYKVLHADRPHTVTSTVTGPPTTATSTITNSVPTTVTLATITAGPTSTITTTTTLSTSTYTTYTLINPAAVARRSVEEKRSPSWNGFSRELIDLVCFDIVYGGKYPTTTKHIAGPTITSTSTKTVTATVPATATIAPPAVTSTLTLTATQTISYSQAFAAQCTGMLISHTAPNSGEREPNLGSCAEACAQESKTGCSAFGYAYGQCYMGLSVTAKAAVGSVCYVYNQL